MKRLLGPLAALLLVSTSCIGGGANERVVLVDYSHDEFNSIMLDYFPSGVTLAQGDTLVFRQIWTGEPHTVTGGTLVDKMMKKSTPLIDLIDGFDALLASGVDLPEEGEEPDTRATEIFRRIYASNDDAAKRKFLSGYDALAEQSSLPDRKKLGDTTNGDLDKAVGDVFDKFFGDIGLPWALDETEDGGFGATQNAGQPCYLKKGIPPKDADKACKDSQQRQPIFDGNASYYNSGLIRYEGPQGNTFRVKFADDIKPGNYFFYCAVHGPNQSTEVTVRPKGSDIPSQADVSRRAQAEIAGFAKPMLKTFRQGRDAKMQIDGETVEGPFAGLSPPVHGAINEFFPKTIRTEVGRKVTWKMMGWDHSISFDVPKYFPIVRWAKNGNVSLNPQLDKPAGGSPEIPEPKEGEILRVDGGTYDGSGFFSSSVFSAEPYAEYSLRFSKPGTYKYACLLHPPMVGTVVVS